MIYTKRFEQHSEYEEFISGGTNVYKPNVSVCEDNYHVHYNPGPPIDKVDDSEIYGVIEIGNIEPFSYEGGEQTGISLTTRATNTWVLTQKSDWLHVEPIRGTGSTTLTVEADEYDNTEENREGFFKVRYTMPDVRYVTTKYDITQEHAPDPKTYPLTFEITGDGNIIWKAQNTAYTCTIEYKKNDGEWTSITSSTGGTNISVVAGDTVQFRGDNVTYSSGSSRYNTFSGTTCQFKAKGNIMSLINSTDFVTATTLQSAYTFYNLFRECTGLTDASNLVLSTTTLVNNCYSNMFYGCTSLTTAPALPATTLASSCYSSMFYNCNSLTTAPELPATTLVQSGYSKMFSYCSSLTTAPALPATTLANCCYDSMFSYCRSLTTAPVLPSTTLAQYCYYFMFSNCTSLTTAPTLPATTLAYHCYSYMFYNCTALTTVPSILPATTLANSCYSNMFSRCTSLTTAPALPATTLAGSCYISMFQGCTSLTNVPNLPALH